MNYFDVVIQLADDANCSLDWLHLQSGANLAALASNHLITSIILHQSEMKILAPENIRRATVLIKNATESQIYAIVYARINKNAIKAPSM